MATITRGTTQQDLIDPNWPATAVTDVLGVLNSVHYPQSKLDGWTPINQEGKLYLIWAGLQQPAAGEQYIVSYNVAPATLLRGTDFVKAAFVVGLRTAYAAQTLFPAYVYHTDDVKSTLGIYESFPKRPFKNPGIVVSTGVAQMDRTTLSDTDMLREERDENGVPISFFAWGSTPIEVKIQIVATQDSDRRKLTDITALFIRHMFTFQFAKFGIGFKAVRINGETEAEWQGQSLFMNSITIPCYTEFQVRYPVALVDVIRDIKVEQIEAAL